MLCYSIGQIKR